MEWLFVVYSVSLFAFGLVLGWYSAKFLITGRERRLHRKLCRERGELLFWERLAKAKERGEEEGRWA